MVAVIRSRAVSDVQHGEGQLPVEYNDEEYVREVLQLDLGQTEVLLDSSLGQQAQQLGITVARSPSPNNCQHGPQQSLSGSTDTATTCHARTASSGSQRSTSTSITSDSSNEFINPLTVHPIQPRRRLSSGNGLSFLEYEKYLAHHEVQDNRKSTSVPLAPVEPAPSLFSVSTRKSYVSIKNGFKSKFRLRRGRASQEDLKYVIHLPRISSL
jgi:hypothetical protein